MRIVLTKCALFFLAFSIFISCKKNVDDVDPQNPLGDSAMYISYFKRSGLEFNRQYLNQADTSYNYYTYLPGKIIHKSFYIDGYGGSADSTQYSYYYDGNKNLTKYENDFFSNSSSYDVKSIVINYSENKINYLVTTFFNGATSKQEFGYSSNDKVISIYDTLPGSFNPEGIIKYKYYFNDAHNVDSAQITEEDVFDPNITRTKTTAFIYDLNQNIKYVIEGRDTSTTYISREARGGEVAATLKKLLSNLYFHVYMKSNTNDALTFFNFDGYGFLYTYNDKFPATSAKHLNSAGNQVNFSFNNVFNSDNLMIKQTAPDGFGSKQEGPSIFEFKYIKAAK